MKNAKAFRSKSAAYIPKQAGAMLLLEFLRDNPDVRLIAVCSDTEHADNFYTPVKLLPSSAEGRVVKYINLNI
jgi:hypothetical protein